jgi:biotin carboxyl carrier protein
VDVKSEWPGRVAEIHVAVGDAVQADDEMITIESMKMLTPIAAPAAGRVTELLVEIDQFVDEGAVLVRLDP